MEQEQLDQILNNLNKLSSVDKKEKYIVEVVKTIQDDDKKIKQIEKFKKEWNKTLVIKTIQDDDKKIEQLKKITNEAYILKIIKTIKDDDKKIKQIEKMTYEIYKIEAIKTIKDDDKKIQQIEKIYYEKNKVEIINSIQDDKKKIALLDLLKTDKCILEVLINIKKEIVDEFIHNSDMMNKYKNLIDLCEKIQKLESHNYKDKNKYSQIGLPKDMAFGIEIEVEGSYAELLWKHRKTYDNWAKETDSSLYNGAEVISPILYDEKENIKRIYEINRALKELKLGTSDRCGAHVHIGANYLKTVEEVKELLEIYGNAEKIYYYISNRPGEVSRRSIHFNAQPISKKIEESNLKESEQDVFIEDAKKVQKDRWSGINLMNINYNNLKNTIEFRISNGTIDADVWIENIRLYGRTVQIAHEIGQIKEKIKNKKTITKSEYEKLKIKEKLKEEISEEEKMQLLMELLFDKEERKVYEERYKVNKELDQSKHMIDKLEFGRVDFENVYNKIDIPKYIMKSIKEENKTNRTNNEKRK